MDGCVHDRRLKRCVAFDYGIICTYFMVCCSVGWASSVDVVVYRWCECWVVASPCCLEGDDCKGDKSDGDAYYELGCLYEGFCEVCCFDVVAWSVENKVDDADVGEHVEAAHERFWLCKVCVMDV